MSLPDVPAGYRITAWRTVAGRRSALHLARASNLMRSPICQNVRSDNRFTEPHDYERQYEKAGACAHCWRIASL